MDRAEAEAIYDAGREVCVQFIVDLAARVQQLEERLTRLEAQARQDSRTSSRPPSMDPPKSRAQRRAEARAKAKELYARGVLSAVRQACSAWAPWRRSRAAARGSDGSRSSITTRRRVAGAGGRSILRQRRPGGRFGRDQVAELPPISVVFSEHRTHQLRCRQCRARTSAQLAGADRRLSRSDRDCRRRW